MEMDPATSRPKAAIVGESKEQEHQGKIQGNQKPVPALVSLAARILSPLVLAKWVMCICTYKLYWFAVTV